MPIFEYECQACGHRFDKLQKHSDAPLKTCPACSEPSLVKCITAPAFRLKGSGWYETDFKKDGKRNLADGDNNNKAPAKDEKNESKATPGKDKPSSSES